MQEGVEEEFNSSTTQYFNMRILVMIGKLDKTFYGNSTLWFCYCNLAKIISNSFIVVCLSLTRSWVFVEKVQKQIYVY